MDLDPVDYDLGAADTSATARSSPTACSTSGGSWTPCCSAVGTPDVPPGVIERGLLLRMRFELDLYVNLRPFSAPADIDMVVIRENTEGVYG